MLPSELAVDVSVYVELDAADAVLPNVPDDNVVETTVAPLPVLPE